MSDPDADRAAMPRPPSPVRDRQRREPRSPKTPQTPTRAISLPASESSRSASQAWSHSSGVLSVATKLELIRISGKNCWACTTADPQACHVLGKRDTQDNLWAHLGLINYSLRSLSNAILLCASCHGQFDRDNDPGFLLVPTDLDFFIEFEKADRIRRQAGRWPPGRQMPTSGMYKEYLESSGKGDAGYTPMFLKHYLLAGSGVTPEMLRLTAPKYWQGAPAAALRRCIMALGSGRIVALGHQVTQLETLRNLYFSPIEGASAINVHSCDLEPQLDPPQFQDQPAQNPDLEEPKSEPDSEDQDSDPESDHDTYGPHSKEPDFNPNRQHDNRKRQGKGRNQQGSRKQAKHAPGATRHATGENWALGPSATTQDAILRYSPIFARG
ncbi:hypothetical protein DTO013E5_3119 [Penicillium roqueforti]|nr:uncharacterized protein LCP9604111_6114 [Penicillium roqueforti]KAF9247924.1 hypothetical protein LCP9604111_6114 [Penicillium roqueforti]KAI1836882.1 hypothetical protein CBS147337_2134 [Penicillium roqueforti]KAI2677940.1 hypothetical protein CBS147355_4941 [Penicillium roqueforti]KAI2686709.1 hypothetical protein LCP963914a_4309 [Penicillium roqueforti]KAI2704304.1 hypothetical protein CBS147372_2773 [Penicillium roqueforti]